MRFHVSLDRLNDFAERFWEYVNGAKVFAFRGEMGAGKTTLISAICHKKGTQDVTGSPTFSIINEYSYVENGAAKKMFHIDLYRLKDEEEIVQAGVEDCVYSGAVCLVEWPEKAPGIFDENTVQVYVKAVSETERTVDVKLPS